MALKKFADASAACIGPERPTTRQYRVFCRWRQWVPQARRRTGDGRINGASRSRAIVLALAAQPSVDQAIGMLGGSPAASLLIVSSDRVVHTHLMSTGFAGHWMWQSFACLDGALPIALWAGILMRPMTSIME
jgi:hypothetical protein